MNWKCPQCGADDNEESSSRCTCGYQPDEKTFQILQWVQPTLKQEFPFHKENQPRTKRQKLGEVLYITPIICLVTVVVLMLLIPWNPSKKAIFAIGSFMFFISTVSSLLTDDIGIRGVGTVRRTAHPIQFWIQFAIQTIFAFVFFLGAIFVAE